MNPTTPRHLFLILLLLFAATPVWGYLDPGSGSLILQLLLGGIAGLGVIIRLYWHKLLSLFGKKPVHDDPAD